MLKFFKFLSLLCAAAMFCSCSPKVTMSREDLMDKIKGGWAGQMFGVVYGGPTEFRWRSAMIPDSVELALPEGRAKWYFDHSEGLYDDIYNDLAFLTVLSEKGIDAGIDDFAEYYKNSKFGLWHANQVGRNNLIKGIPAPESGHWHNNPHADDIDFQIEADFAGLVAPCMPQAALSVCDRTGHIMNYGDGYYGGLYMATMYTLAFYYTDINAVVKDALKAIPQGTKYYNCISDTIRWCEENDDWKTTWQLVQDKWNIDSFCPEGAGAPYNIDATINSAYVVMGLLYGQGDFAKTLEISTRCGQDSDCNPASACGILGTMVGYSNISDEFLSNVKEVEDRKFKFPAMSLNDTYAMTETVALDMIRANGGKVTDEEVTIDVQRIRTAAYEQSFEGLKYNGKDSSCATKDFTKPWTYSFEGCGFSIAGQISKKKTSYWSAVKGYVGLLEVTVDGVTKTVKMPLDRTHEVDVYWDYQLKDGKHDVSIVWTNPDENINLVIWAVHTYSPEN